MIANELTSRRMLVAGPAWLVRASSILIERNQLLYREFNWGSLAKFGSLLADFGSSRRTLGVPQPTMGVFMLTLGVLVT